jgi:putative transposase
MKRLRNKKLAELQRKMNKCKKGSRQWKKYNRAKRYILSKAKAQSTDTLHKKFVNWCVEQRMHVVSGDVEGIQCNAKRRDAKRLTRNYLNGNLVSF